MSLSRSTDVLDQISDPELELEHGPKTHIVRRRGSGSPIAEVMEARINGTPLEALCGHIWVPSRDPKSLPLCDPCKQIFELYGDMGDHDGSDPMDLPS